MYQQFSPTKFSVPDITGLMERFYCILYPVFVSSQVPDQQIRSSTKPWLEKADWNKWSCALQEECDESFAKTLDADNLDTRWDTIRTAIHEVTSRCIPLKVTSRHSKPF